jgi:diguanylate cyclase (GGDEF)-like protein
LCLLIFDHFKSINDSYGHLSGDQVLRTLARTLSVGLRKINIIGRYGGEEFGVLLLDTPAKAAFADDQMYLAKAEGRNRIVGEQNG